MFEFQTSGLLQMLHAKSALPYFSAAYGDACALRDSQHIIQMLQHMLAQNLSKHGSFREKDFSALSEPMIVRLHCLDDEALEVPAQMKLSVQAEPLVMMEQIENHLRQHVRVRGSPGWMHFLIGMELVFHSRAPCSLESWWNGMAVRAGTHWQRIFKNLSVLLSGEKYTIRGPSETLPA